MIALEKAARASYAHARSHAPHWPEWENITDEARAEWTNNAKAVLLAVREPDGDVVDALYACEGDEFSIWTDGIDAILNEPPTKTARTDDSSPPQ